MPTSSPPALETSSLYPETSRTSPERHLEINPNTNTSSLAGHIHAVLGALGENPERAGLRDTPERVAHAFRSLTIGAAMDPVSLLRSGLIRAATPEMVLVPGVEFCALCERYLLPFFGRVYVAYFPDETTADAETIDRVIDVLARRLQTQERLTHQIHDVFVETLAPRGVATVIRAQHTSILMQGPEKQHPELMTYTCSGAFRDPENEAALTWLMSGRSADHR